MRISLVLSIFGLAVGVDPSSALRSTRPKTPKTGFRKKPIVLPKTLKTGFRNSKRPNVLTMDVASSSSSLPEPPATTSRYKSYTDSLDVNSLPNFSILLPFFLFRCISQVDFYIADPLRSQSDSTIRYFGMILAIKSRQTKN
ncbi:hypothetical protein F5148DRAFT_1260081 [Russula earlei]|uniref:Uncharacterized protein n=1 Tax=Russula earlei TaxID=71964 RepID=A0ACC0TS90_9AGAM|nr:hypothetical protein F5148DRAFT_1260081 [Russula earlei]